MKIVFLSAALVAATPALAQTAPAPDPAGDEGGFPFDPVARQPDVVVTASGVAQDADTTGQAVTVLDRATIERRQTVVLSDLLATTPGVTVSRNGGVGGFTAVRIRGAEGEQTLTLIDGVRVNDPSSPGGGFDFANLLAGSVERVEVLRGPDSVPWGSQAIGGVVNIVTEAPTDGLRARANAEGGSMGTFFGSAALSGRVGIASGALTGGYLTTDGVSAYAPGVERDGYRQGGATGRLELAFTPTIRLDLRGYWADSRAELDGFPAPAFAFADDREYSTAQELYGYAGLHADTANGRFRNTLAFQIADIDRDNYDRDAGPAPIFLARGRSERYTYAGDLRPTDGVRLVAGAEHEETRFGDGASRFSRGVTSVWGEAILTPAARLTVTGGVRHDDDEAFGGHTTFGANAAWALPTGTTLRASYAEGFKAPTLYQLYAPFYGTPTLRPETAHSVDAGVEQRLIGDTLVASATYFRRRTTNQIDFDLGTFTYGNIDRARAEGAEVALTLRPTAAFLVVGELSYIDAENRSPGPNDGKDLARRPRETASLSADYRFPFGLSLGGTVLAVGDSFDDPANSVRLDGYAVAGVRAELPVGRRLSVYGRVDNLFDARYATVADYGVPGRAAYGGVRVRLD